MENSYDPKSRSKERKTDRVLVVSPIPNKYSVNNLGMLDARIFNTNNLHAVQDLRTSLWSLNYDRGVLPSSLKQRFTTFKKLIEYVREYFTKRNIEIKEIID